MGRTIWNIVGFIVTLGLLISKLFRLIHSNS
ncbi:hypothetical protein [Flavobacterium sp. RSP49]|nr:hypothetical protein [Flavobacterium sp. RSP49]